MNIVYSTDENYAIHTYISLKTLLLNNEDSKIINVFIIDNKISSTTKDYFYELIQSFSCLNKVRSLEFLDFAKFEYLVKNATPCGSLSTYGRLFLQEYLNADKVLYIDCDTIINGSLESLYNLDIENYAIAGVQDIVSFSNRKPLGLEETDRYINAGVILINLKYWRKVNGMVKCLNFLKKFNGKVPFEDQGTVNGVFKGKILIINPKYNLMNHFIKMSANKIALISNVKNYYSNKEVREANRDPIIVHFTAGHYMRPWFQNSNHPYAKIYHDQRALSPWGKEKLQKGKAVKFLTKIKRNFILLTPYCFLKQIYKFKRKNPK